MEDVTAFRMVDVPDAEVDAVEARYGPLAGAVRDLVDATIRSRVGDDEVAVVLAAVREATARLRADQADGPAGVNYNATGRAWNWGNAVAGVRNAIAPPLSIEHGPDGRTSATLHLGAAYEGPPGCVHGGVGALLLDHLMGVTASQMKKVTLTGTLTLRYRDPLPLGEVRLTGEVVGEEGRKVFVEARIEGRLGVAIEAEGTFVVPRWSGDFEQTR
ncbi:MAG: PaaI family thioesterase [Nocardioidaceae bacterium]|nr:PaaI family thioesterase [Nocardioidaceae bacterium]